MNPQHDPVRNNLLRQVPAGLAWARKQELILPDYRCNLAAGSFLFRANAYGLQWVPGKQFREAMPVHGQAFGGMISRDAHDYGFLVLGPTPLSPNIKGRFVCLHAPKRDARSAPRLGLMIETLVYAVALHQAKWSPPYDRRVAEWLWEHRDTLVPVPQPGIAWALTGHEGKGAS